MKRILFYGTLVCASLLAYDKTVIAHRGASGYLPEHTLESKSLAHAMNVDYIEQDLAMTKDNHLIVIHDHYLDTISDVAEKFPDRARKDGRYYAIDFTLDEIKTLNACEAFSIKDGKKVANFPDRFPLGKSNFKINTFEEEIELIQGLNKSRGKDIGLYVEVKVPWFHKQEGKDISKVTLEVLKKYGYTTKDSKVYFQSFDYPDLVDVKTKLMPAMNMDLKLVALIGRKGTKETYELKDGKWELYDFDYLRNPKNFKEISKYVDALGSNFELVIDAQKSKKGKIVTNNFAQQAHQNNMLVHIYTFRKDQLPQYANNLNELFDAVLYKAGADGGFTDFPDLMINYLNNKQSSK